MTDWLDIGHGARIPVAEIELRTSRSSGPGGQHANVTASRVEAVFDVAGSPSLDEYTRARLLARLGPRVTAIAQDARSQLRNREVALERLQARLTEGNHIPRARRPTRPTKASVRRAEEAKRANSARKQARRRDFDD